VSLRSCRNVLLVSTREGESSTHPVCPLLTCYSMDQAASVFSLHGSALYVTFKPSLNFENIEFPQTEPELTFVTAQSFVAADKHVTAPVCYNLRVVECTLAAVFAIGSQLAGLPRHLFRREGRRSREHESLCR
jgi:galactokinase